MKKNINWGHLLVYEMIFPTHDPETSESAETTGIPTKGKFAHQGAMAYLSAIAYPDIADWTKRDEFIAALRAKFGKLYISHGGNREKIRTEYRKLPNRKINNTIAKARYRIVSRRLPAAMILKEFIFRRLIWLKLQSQELPVKKKANPTITSISKMLARQLRRGRSGNLGARKEDHPDFDWEIHEDNFMGRVWSSSKPVLHLSFALLEAVAADFPTHAGEFQMLKMVHEPKWLDFAVEKAEILRSRLINTSVIDIPAEKTVCLLSK